MIHNIACEDFLANYSGPKFDLTVTSPPYGTLRKYKGFQTDIEKVAELLYEHTSDGGVCCWEIEDEIIKGKARLLPERHALIFDAAGWNTWDVIYRNPHGVRVPTELRYYNTISRVYCFSKGRPKTLNLIEDRPNIAAGRLETTVFRESKEAKGKRKAKRYVTKVFGRRTCLWQYGPETHKNPHPANMSQQLCRDLIISYSNQGDLVFDPYSGSGTTWKGCIGLDRNFIGTEISADYCEMAFQRVLNNLFS